MFVPTDHTLAGSSPLAHRGRSRRSFLTDARTGLAGVALAALLQQDRSARSGEPLRAPLPPIAPRAKSVIWYFMLGGTSHLESFDPKPAVTKFAGKTIDESPYKSAVLDSPYYRRNVRDFAGTPRALMAKLYPLQVGFTKRGASGKTTPRERSMRSIRLPVWRSMPRSAYQVGVASWSGSAERCVK